MYSVENSESDSYSPFLSTESQRRASAPALNDDDFTNYGATSQNPLLGRTSTTIGRDGYDPRLPIIADAYLVPNTPPRGTRILPPPKKKHGLCFLPCVVLLCVAAFVYEMWFNNWTFEPFHQNPMFGPSAGTLVRCGAKVDCLIEDHQEFYRVFSPMWLHAGVIHIVANMGATMQLGFPLEREFGWKSIFPLYMVSGVVGTLCSILFLPNSIMVGASGAVFGLLGACWAEFLMNENNQRTRSVFFNLFLVTILNLAIGTTPLLDNFAHTGGMLAGLIWGMFLLRTDDHGCGGFLSLTIAMCVTVGAFVAVVAHVHLDEQCTWCGFINCIPTPFWECSEASFNGPCSVMWLPKTSVLNVTCIEGPSHFISNVTTEQANSQSFVAQSCSQECKGICWNGFPR